MEKPYLITVSIRDGEHEHTNRVVFYHKNIDKATKYWTEKKLNEWFAYDSVVIVRLEMVDELDQKDADVLERLGVVNVFRLPRKG